jgi:hypothetical protein
METKVWFWILFPFIFMPAALAFFLVLYAIDENARQWRHRIFCGSSGDYRSCKFCRLMINPFSRDP